MIAEELKDEINSIYPLDKSLTTDNDATNRFANRYLRKKYTNFTTKLAFRKFQARNSEGIQRDFYLTEIDQYRKKIDELIFNKKA